jgi:endonuclease/exonuclease/phosphatase family metal-dependent hydrolase
MELICLNAWGGTLHEELLAFLAAETPDVLCLQEVIHTPSTDKERLTYRDGDHVLPQRPNLFRDVARTLPDHAAVFCPAAQGVLWDGNRAIPSQWGLATFVRQAFPIVGQVQGFVHKDYSPHDYGAHPRSRSAHGIRIYDYDRDRFVSVTHMHGLRDMAGKTDTPDRTLQAHKLLDISRQVADRSDIAIVCGDFNVEPGSETLRLFEERGMTELVTRADTGGTRTSFYKKAGRFADYMLVSDPGRVRRFDVIREPEVSDHCPLSLEI